MTPIQKQLDAIKQRAEAATPGPWRKPDEYDDGHDIHCGPVDGPIKIAGNYDYEEGGILETADRDFISSARTDVPRLVAALEHALETQQQIPIMLAMGADVDGYLDDRDDELAAILEGKP